MSRSNERKLSNELLLRTSLTPSHSNANVLTDKNSIKSSKDAQSLLRGGQPNRRLGGSRNSNKQMSPNSVVLKLHIGDAAMSSNRGKKGRNEKELGVYVGGHDSGSRLGGGGYSGLTREPIVGDVLPSCKMLLGSGSVRLCNFFKDKWGVFFGGPGAFDPVCTNIHLPSFLSIMPALRQLVPFVGYICTSNRNIIKAWTTQISTGLNVEPSELFKGLTVLSDHKLQLSDSLGLLDPAYKYSQLRRFALVISPGARVAWIGWDDYSFGEAVLDYLLRSEGSLPEFSNEESSSSTIATSVIVEGPDAISNSLPMSELEYDPERLSKSDHRKKDLIPIIPDLHTHSLKVSSHKNTSNSVGPTIMSREGVMGGGPGPGGGDFKYNTANFIQQEQNSPHHQHHIIPQPFPSQGKLQHQLQSNAFNHHHHNNNSIPTKTTMNSTSNTNSPRQVVFAEDNEIQGRNQHRNASDYTSTSNDIHDLLETFASSTTTTLDEDFEDEDDTDLTDTNRYGSMSTHNNNNNNAVDSSSSPPPMRNLNRSHRSLSQSVRERRASHFVKRDGIGPGVNVMRNHEVVSQMKGASCSDKKETKAKRKRTREAFRPLELIQIVCVAQRTNPLRDISQIKSLYFKKSKNVFESHCDLMKKRWTDDPDFEKFKLCFDYEPPTYNIINSGHHLSINSNEFPMAKLLYNNMICHAKYMFFSAPSKHNFNKHCWSSYRDPLELSIIFQPDRFLVPEDSRFSDLVEATKDVAAIVVVLTFNRPINDHIRNDLLDKVLGLPTLDEKCGAFTVGDNCFNYGKNADKRLPLQAMFDDIDVSNMRELLRKRANTMQDGILRSEDGIKGLQPGDIIGESVPSVGFDMEDKDEVCWYMYEGYVGNTGTKQGNVIFLVRHSSFICTQDQLIAFDKIIGGIHPASFRVPKCDSIKDAATCLTMNFTSSMAMLMGGLTDTATDQDLDQNLISPYTKLAEFHERALIGHQTFSNCFERLINKRHNHIMDLLMDPKFEDKNLNGISFDSLAEGEQLDSDDEFFSTSIQDQFCIFNIILTKYVNKLEENLKSISENFQSSLDAMERHYSSGDYKKNTFKKLKKKIENHSFRNARLAPHIEPSAWANEAMPYNPFEMPGQQRQALKFHSLQWLDNRLLEGLKALDLMGESELEDKGTSLPIPEGDGGLIRRSLTINKHEEGMKARSVSMTLSLTTNGSNKNDERMKSLSSVIMTEGDANDSFSVADTNQSPEFCEQYSLDTSRTISTVGSQSTDEKRNVLYSYSNEMLENGADNLTGSQIRLAQFISDQLAACPDDSSGDEDTLKNLKVNEQEFTGSSNTAKSIRALNKELRKNELEIKAQLKAKREGRRCTFVHHDDPIISGHSDRDGYESSDHDDYESSSEVEEDSSSVETSSVEETPEPSSESSSEPPPPPKKSGKKGKKVRMSTPSSYTTEESLPKKSKKAITKRDDNASKGGKRDKGGNKKKKVDTSKIEVKFIGNSSSSSSDWQSRKKTRVAKVKNRQATGHPGLAKQLMMSKKKANFKSSSTTTLSSSSVDEFTSTTDDGTTYGASTTDSSVSEKRPVKKKKILMKEAKVEIVNSSSSDGDWDKRKKKRHDSIARRQATGHPGLAKALVKNRNAKASDPSTDSSDSSSSVTKSSSITAVLQSVSSTSSSEKPPPKKSSKNTKSKRSTANGAGGGKKINKRKLKVVDKVQVLEDSSSSSGQWAQRKKRRAVKVKNRQATGHPGLAKIMAKSKQPSSSRKGARGGGSDPSPAATMSSSLPEQEDSTSSSELSSKSSIQSQDDSTTESGQQSLILSASTVISKSKSKKGVEGNPNSKSNQNLDLIFFTSSGEKDPKTTSLQDSSLKSDTSTSDRGSGSRGVKITSPIEKMSPTADRINGNMKEEVIVNKKVSKLKPGPGEKKTTKGDKIGSGGGADSQDSKSGNNKESNSSKKSTEPKAKAAKSRWKSRRFQSMILTKAEAVKMQKDLSKAGVM